AVRGVKPQDAKRPGCLRGCPALALPMPWGMERGQERLSGNRRLDDLARLARRLALGQRVDIFHAFDHFAPDGVLVVEEAGILEADEELAVRAVRILRTRHRTDAANVRFAVEFCGKVGKLAAAHARSRRIAALRHEAGDHAVKDDAIVEAFARELADPLD